MKEINIITELDEKQPISRSQAKIICNKIFDCNEVVIDFCGALWMGQGFAHQLFVIFPREHSDVQLLPINMNEDVVKMYNHVTLGRDDLL